MIWVAVAAAGALGAAARYLVDHLVSARVSGLFPWGTLVVNVTGSLAAGIALGLAAAHALPDGLDTVVAGGFLGAYTTFSTAMYQTAQLLDEDATATAASNLLITLAASVVAAILGWATVT